MSEPTAGEMAELEYVTTCLEGLAQAIERSWTQDKATMPGLDRGYYEMYRYRSVTSQLAAKMRHLLSREQGGGGDVPPPGPADVEDLLCPCGRPLQQRRMGMVGTWVRFCPEHGLRYAESVPGGETTNHPL